MKGSRVQVSDSALDRETVAHATVFLFNVLGLALNEGSPKSPFLKGRFRGNVKISPNGMQAHPEFKSRIQLMDRETVAHATVYLLNVLGLVLNEGPPKSPFLKGRFRGNVKISPNGMQAHPEFKSRIQLWRSDGYLSSHLFYVPKSEVSGPFSGVKTGVLPPPPFLSPFFRASHKIYSTA